MSTVASFSVEHVGFIDATGRYAALYRPCHLIGLELGVSVISAALRGEATGSPQAFNGDVMATAKRDLAALVFGGDRRRRQLGGGDCAERNLRGLTFGSDHLRCQLGGGDATQGHR